MEQGRVAETTSQWLLRFAATLTLLLLKNDKTYNVNKIRMELNDGDVAKLQQILRFIGQHSATRTVEVAEKTSIGVDDVFRLRIILVEHNAISDKYSDMIMRNENTRNYHDGNYFEEVYKNQQESKQHKEEESRARRIAIRNGKWAIPLSITSMVLALVTLILSIFGVI
jgi:hypothetical protein